jgi:hypothetical protein
MTEMYREPLDQATQNDIAAAAAAHRELGPDYDAAVAEGLVERIGIEIDKRVEARLGDRANQSRSVSKVSQSGSRHALLTGGITGAGVGAGVVGLVAIVVNDGMSTWLVPAVIATWLILAITALAILLIRMNRHRDTDDPHR